MLRCDEISRLVSDSMDRRLTFGQRLAVRFHLLYCVGCRRFRTHIRLLRDAILRHLGQTGGALAGAVVGLDESARLRIKSALAQEPPANPP